MTGPSIRNWEIAAVLARENDVTLAVPGTTDRSHPKFNVVTYDDVSVTSLIRAHEVVLASGYLLVGPFGISEKPPTANKPAFRGVIAGISTSDFLVLWGGGIWNWFDPLTLIRAAATLVDNLPTLRVLFPAPVSPSEQVLPMRM